MSDNRDTGHRNRPAFTARSRSRSTSRTRHVSQPIISSTSSSHRQSTDLSALSSGARDMQALFDRVAPLSTASVNKPRIVDPAPTTTSETLKSKAPVINIDPGTPEPTSRAPKPSSSTLKAPTPTSAESSSTTDKFAFDENTVRQLILFTKMQKALGLPMSAGNTPPPSTPTTSIRDLTISLQKSITMVPKLAVNGKNFHTWLIMIRQVLESVVNKSLPLDDPDIILDVTEDTLLKTAILATVNDNLKASIAEQASGIDGFQLINETFTLRSRTSHIATFKEIMDLKFNHLDRNANIDSHFRRVENLMRNLFRSGFVVNEESLIGLMFHLSLPNLESFPFVNVARQLDQRMERGDFVRNTELVRIAKNELALFRQNRRHAPERRADKDSASPGGNSNTNSKPSQSTSNKWCSRCRMSNHNTTECTRQINSGAVNTNPFRNIAPTTSNAHRAATAPPRVGLHANSVETNGGDSTVDFANNPVLQSISLDDFNPQVTQEEIDQLIHHGALQEKLDQLPAVDMWHAPTKLPWYLHPFTYAAVWAQSLCNMHSDCALKLG